jgi:amino acid transporter
MHALHDAPPSAVSQALAKERLGVLRVLFFVLSSIGPLLVTAGLIPSAYAATGLTAEPAALLVVGLVLCVFTVGYATYAKYIPNAGALYAMIAQGLGKPTGVGAAFVALIAYNMLQIGIYGMFGPTMRDFAATNFGWNLPWWTWALLLWAVVGSLGLRRVDLNSLVLGVFSLIEIILVTTLTIRGLMHPAAGAIHAGSLSPLSLRGAGFGPLVAIAVLAFTGFEQTAVYSEEARNVRRTIPHATYLALIGIGVVYIAASFAMNVHYGSATVTTAQTQGSGMLFALGSGLLTSAGHTLFLTSLFAAALGFHNACWRYTYSLGREGVLPTLFARTGRANIPRWSSGLQSLIGFGAIVLTGINHWDPTTRLFYWMGTTGGFLVLLLLAATSFAVIRFFLVTKNADARDEPRAAWLVAPAIAGVVLCIMIILCVQQYALLLGVTPGSPAATVLPALSLVGLLGAGWAMILKRRARHIYDLIGLGPESTLRRSGSPIPITSIQESAS